MAGTPASMQTYNTTPFAVEWLVSLDGKGFEQLLVLFKATFDLTRFKGRIPEPADEQEPIRVGDEYRGDPGKSSLLHAGEGALFKPSTDVMLAGHAHPRKIGDPAVNVALQVGALKKQLIVHGDRKWQAGVVDLVPSTGAPFAKIPIVYERAFGGTDPGDETTAERFLPNPVGIGFRGKKNPLNFRGMPVPNLEHPSHPIEHPGRSGFPCGLGPIGPHWEPRSKFAGTYDDTWMEERMPLLPADFNLRFHHCVPADQITREYIKGGEPVAVVGATESGSLGFTLPTVVPEVVTRIGGDDRELRAHCDTVVVDTDRMLLTMLWRASTSIQGRLHEYEYVRTRQLRA